MTHPNAPSTERLREAEELAKENALLREALISITSSGGKTLILAEYGQPCSVEANAAYGSISYFARRALNGGTSDAE